MNSQSNNTQNNRGARRNAGRRGNNNNNRGNPRNLVAQPNFRSTLIYAHSHGYGSLTATENHLLLRANSCFDPEYAVGGGQPLGFDQLSALYSTYMVRASRIEATITNKGDPSPTSSGQGGVLCVVVYPSVFPAAPLNIAHALEQPFARHVFLTPPNTGGSTKTVSSAKRSTAAMYGSNANDLDFKAAVNANPAKEWYWHVCTFSMGGEPLQIIRTVKLYYDVAFSQRVILAQS